MFFKRSVLVVGQGAREHALVWKLAQSPIVETLYCAPGNAGTALEDKVTNVAINATDVDALLAFALEKKVYLTVVGPEAPLAQGIVDMFEARGLRIFGPCKEAAQLESSKTFAKQFMKEWNIPTARFESFTNANEAYNYCVGYDWARVIKVDGLAQGKGVYVCDSLDDCKRALAEIFSGNRFGDAGKRVVIEERLNGPEVSLMVLSDGNMLTPLATSRDYKRRFDDNKGPNTGGMGAYSPVPDADALWPLLEENILTPLENALQKAPFTYKGLLYIGVMMHNNEPMVLEFNARFGDPETQCVLPRLENDLFMLLEACAIQILPNYYLFWKDDACVCLNLTAAEYPSGVVSREPIHLPAELPENTAVFHAGTLATPSGDMHANGGRILSIAAWGTTHEDARANAYILAEQIDFNGKAYRQDIAKEVALCPSA